MVAGLIKEDQDGFVCVDEMDDGEVRVCLCMCVCVCVCVRVCVLANSNTEVFKTILSTQYAPLNYAHACFLHTLVGSARACFLHTLVGSARACFLHTLVGSAHAYPLRKFVGSAHAFPLHTCAELHVHATCTYRHTVHTTCTYVCAQAINNAMCVMRSFCPGCATWASAGALV